MRALPRAARLVATCLGAGYSPVAPGTAGAAVALPVFALALAPRPWPIQLAAVALLVWPATLAAGAVARQEGRQDPALVVIDEFVGMWLAMVGTTGWLAWGLAFLWFRAFDIVKPFPVGTAERIPGGAGIVADDLVAGAYAAAATQLTLWLLGGR